MILDKAKENCGRDFSKSSKNDPKKYRWSIEIWWMFQKRVHVFNLATKLTKRICVSEKLVFSIQIEWKWGKPKNSNSRMAKINIWFRIDGIWNLSNHRNYLWQNRANGLPAEQSISNSICISFFQSHYSYDVHTNIYAYWYASSPMLASPRTNTMTLQVKCVSTRERERESLWIHNTSDLTVHTV